RVLDVIPRNSRTAAGFWQLGVFVSFVLLRSGAAASDFRFDRDTVGFANATVFEYREGHHYLRQRKKGEPKRYTRRCFVLCRTTMQFQKFARFDPHAAPLDDNALAARIRNVTRRAAWGKPLPADQRVVFPGYANLRAMSEARREVVRANIGLGWPTYFRLGNARMLFQHGSDYHKETHANLNAALCATSYSSVFSPLILVSASITRSWSTNENLPPRMVELTAISFTTPIIQNRRVSSPGPPATVLSHIKKIGISLAASCAFIKFMASGYSEDDSFRETTNAR